MSKGIKLKTILIGILLINFQILNVVVSSTSTFYPFKINNDVYQWFWHGLAEAPGPISGEDVVYWGEDLGPYHNYTELTSRLSLMNDTFTDLVDVFSNR